MRSSSLHSRFSGRRPSPGGRAARAFTLLEVLLALAIIGLLAGVLIGTGARVFSDKPVSPDEVFWAAVQEARKMALKSERDVAMKFTDDKDKGKEFVVTNGESTKEFPVPAPGDLEITFLVPQAGGGNLITIAGTAIETSKIPAVAFYADGTCTAFRAQFFRNGAVHIVSIDQWTCAPVLLADTDKR